MLGGVCCWYLRTVSRKKKELGQKMSERGGSKNRGKRKPQKKKREKKTKTYLDDPTVGLKARLSGTVRDPKGEEKR